MDPPELPGMSLGRCLGRGAFGAVYEAIDMARGPVAVKILTSGGAPHEEVAALAHPNLLKLHEVAQHQGVHYVVMERVEGVSLLEWVRPPRASIDPARMRPTIPLAFGQPVQEGGLSAFAPIDRSGLDRLVPAAHALASALTGLHDAGKVHRDLRPENVLVERDGRVVLIDYGLMMDVGEKADDVAGSPAYMAPDDAPTPASDWYSFGVLLFESLTGALPFAGTAHEVIVRKRTVAAPSPSFVAELPDDPRARRLDDLCVKLLRRVPELRPRGAEVLAALH